ncbi:MAG: glycosyltransferase family 1 protein [Verrucomicrobia bacterium]|nr:glycosyltransferase family 1 protein [Verrucomicrobiota bacterium]
MKPFRSVFALVSDCHARTGHYQQLWQRHFYDGLRGALETVATPHDVEFDWARGAAAATGSAFKEARARTSERLREQILGAHRRSGLDAVISYCFGGDLEPGLVSEVTHSGIPWINFYCDSTHRFVEIAALARIVSLNWFPEHAAIPNYRALGVPILCAPYALNPDCLPDLSCQSPRHDSAFIGLPTSNRITQLGLLRLLGCRVAIRGHVWADRSVDPFHNAARKKSDWLAVLFRRGLGEKFLRRCFWPIIRAQAEGPLGDGEFGEFLRQSQIILGLNQGRDEAGRLTSYLKFRDVEFPGYACCYLTEFNEDVAAAFEIGKEILTYQSMWEAAQKIKFYSRRREVAQRIGRAGRARVLASQVWPIRLQQLAQAL